MGKIECKSCLINGIWNGKPIMEFKKDGLNWVNCNKCAAVNCKAAELEDPSAKTSELEGKIESLEQ
jgi:hypothetical protein